MRVGLWIAAALVLLVCAASATLRLSQAQVGCSPWPACQAQYAASAVAATPVEPSWHEPVRLAHRISASLVGIVFLCLVTFGWMRWSASERVAGTLLLLASLGLAWLGRYTPSPLPAVVLGNLIGGHLLLAALVWLLAAKPAHIASATVSGGLPGVPVWLVVAALLQIALGGLVSARAAAGACLSDCAWDSLRVAAPTALNPFVVLPELAPDAVARQAALLAHVVGAIGLWLLAALAVWPARRRGTAWSPLVLVTLTTLLGLTMARGVYPLGVAVAHSLSAALVLSLAVFAWRIRRPPPQAGRMALKVAATPRSRSD